MAENSRPSWDDLVQLVTELDGSDFDNVAVEYDGISVRMSRGDLSAESVGQLADGTAAAAPLPQSTTSETSNAAPAPPAVASPETAPQAAPAAPQGTAVTSPMMGVFYRSPSPGAPPFVTEGDAVEADSTIGIIEVMKMMNPVHAGVAGAVSSFAADDTQAVEFGQDLAYIIPEGS